MSMDERVLCLPTVHVRAVANFQGFLPVESFELSRLLNPTQFSFRQRAECETDAAYKQLIPYVVLRCGPSLFHYRRGVGGSETRLTARRSIGVGGHISEIDAAIVGDPYRTGMLRELSEEVVIGADFTERFLGLINDDSTPVGSVHLGVVHLFDLNRPDVTPREAGIADAGFAPAAHLSADLAEFETWSRFVLATL